MTRSNSPLAELARWCGAVLVVFMVALTAGPALADPGSEPGRFGFGQPMRVEADERVETIVTIGGDLTVMGEVVSNAVVIGGSLELGPEARVGGDVVAVGGSITRHSGAVVVGDRMEVSGAVIGTRTGEPRMIRDRALASSLAILAQIIGSFLISLVILAFAPRRIRTISEELRTKPGRSILLGLAIVVLFLPLLGALTVSIVGIPLIPVAIMLLAAVLIVGLTGLAVRIGYWMPFYAEHRSAFGALALGYLLLAVIGLIPWVGAVVIPLVALFAGGAVLSSWIGGRGRRTVIVPETRPPEPQPMGA
jgi:hypothetical protein